MYGEYYKSPLVVNPSQSVVRTFILLLYCTVYTTHSTHRRNVQVNKRDYTTIASRTVIMFFAELIIPHARSARSARFDFYVP